MDLHCITYNNSGAARIAPDPNVGPAKFATCHVCTFKALKMIFRCPKQTCQRSGFNPKITKTWDVSNISNCALKTNDQTPSGVVGPNDQHHNIKVNPI